MLSKTHLTIGLASALTIAMPKSPEAMLPVLLGGAVGSIICDIDCKYDRPSKDALIGRIIAGGISALSIGLDFVWRGEMTRFCYDANKIALFMGAILFFVTGYISRESDHRTFSHSLVAFFIYTIGLYFFLRPAVLAFVIGFVSHILLDVLNFRPVHIFYPISPGVSLKLCRAKSKVNTSLMCGGLLWLIVVFVVTLQGFRV